MSGRGLDVDAVSVRLASTLAVDDLSLCISPGEVVALLGPSGCGKSTLLRAIAGLEQLAAGAVSWDGADLRRVPVHQRGFGLLFQDGQLFPHRDVAGNVEFGLRMAGIGPRERHARVAELLELVGLTGLGQRKVSSLSGGEQQRVALARSLAPHPRLLLLDEPLSALDRALRERLVTDLGDILRSTRTTALYVTHDHDEAFAVADRIGVMERGRLLQIATAHELWRRPLDEQVARFLGYGWFVPAVALGSLARLVGAGPGDAIALRADSFVTADEGPLCGRVLGHRVSRSGTTVSVSVDRLGTVEARSPGGRVPRIGAGVRLRLEPDRVAVLRGS